FDLAKPSSSVAHMYNDLSRPHCRILMQLHTGHMCLNMYLHHFNLATSALCSSCLVPELVPHFLLSCPMYQPQCVCLISCLGSAASCCANSFL
ncbi:hypothetical protein B0H10DRAFT_1792807, partial [Mycena sp. CBHHK59/15]